MAKLSGITLMGRFSYVVSSQDINCLIVLAGGIERYPSLIRAILRQVPIRYVQRTSPSYLLRLPGRINCGIKFLDCRVCSNSAFLPISHPLDNATV